MSNEQQQATDAEPTEAKAEEAQEQTFTQADVDRIVSERVQRERAKFSDYDDLKVKAGEAKTAEERLAALEQQYAAAKVAAVRADVASRYGISAEDRDLFLTSSDEQQLEAQAKRLSERVSEHHATTGNYVPSEGNNPRPKEDERRAFANLLTGHTS